MDSTMHRAFMKLMTINTLRRPSASANEPQMYAPAIMPGGKTHGKWRQPFARICSRHNNIVTGHRWTLVVTTGTSFTNRWIWSSSAILWTTCSAWGRIGPTAVWTTCIWRPFLRWCWQNRTRPTINNGIFRNLIGRQHGDG